MNKIILMLFAATAVLAFVLLAVAVDRFVVGHYLISLRAWIACAILTSGALLLAIYLNQKEK